jgi:hypothetical protein
MIVFSVVSSAAAALKLLLWSDTIPIWVLVTTGHTPRCIAAVRLRVSKALGAIALQRLVWGVVRLYLYSQEGFNWSQAWQPVTNMLKQSGEPMSKEDQA